MAKKTKKSPRCALCGAEFVDETRAFAHSLVAHGSLKPDRRRRKVRKALPGLHRKLEEAGFDEAQAHLIIQVVAEEFRKAGLV